MIPLFFLLCLSACKKTKPSRCNEEAALYALSDYPIGAAINPARLRDNARYKEIAIKQFNSITPENIFKPSYLHPAENSFAWAEADSLADLCMRYGKRLHGHTLIWHQQLPAWMEQYQGNWDELLKDHVQTIVRHFKGRVSSWDVVNEAFNEDGTLRNSVWKQHLGDSYLEKAFAYAHEADPDVLLFYNDYTLELNPTKRSAVLKLLNNLRARGLRVDGIGLQMHINMDIPGIEPLADALKEVAEQDYNIHLSELDLSLNPSGKGIASKPNAFEKQAEVLGKVVLQYNAVPARLRYGLTFWGIGDGDSWIRSYYNREDYPLLYDDDYAPKPAYCKLKEEL